MPLTPGAGSGSGAGAGVSGKGSGDLAADAGGGAGGPDGGYSGAGFSGGVGEPGGGPLASGEEPGAGGEVAERTDRGYRLTGSGGAVGALCVSLKSAAPVGARIIAVLHSAGASPGRGHASGELDVPGCDHPMAVEVDPSGQGRVPGGGCGRQTANAGADAGPPAHGRTPTGGGGNRIEGSGADVDLGADDGSGPQDALGGQVMGVVAGGSEVGGNALRSPSRGPQFCALRVGGLGVA